MILARWKPLGLILAVLLLTPALSIAQNDDDDTGKQSNRLRAGSSALQFQITDNFRLSSFQGAVMSFKRHWSAKSAFRLGVSLDFTIQDNDRVSTFTRNDTLLDSDVDEFGFDGQFVQIDLQYLRYANPDARLNMFAGVGPLVGFDRSSFERTSGPGGQSRSSFDDTSWRVGATGLVGVEWFATKNISIHAEYGLVMEYIWLREKRKTSSSGATASVRDTDEVTKVGDLRARSVLFGLSAYF